MQKTLHILDKIGWALPFLAGILLVLSKFSENAHRIPWSQLPQSLLFSLIVSGIALGIFYAIPITRKVAGLVSSVFVLVTMLWMLFPSQLIPVALMLLAIVLLPRLKVRITAFAVFILIVACLGSLTMAGINTNRTAVEASQDGEITLLRTPDIYFVVPDRFTSPVGLLAMGYNDSEFVSYLRDEGFYLNEGALSKDQINPTDRGVATTRTGRFLASVLNLGEEVRLNIPYNVCSQMIKYNKVARILKANGYKYYHIGDWWPETETNPLADVNYVYKSGSFMPTEELPMVILDRSIWRYMDTFFTRSSDVYRNRNLYQLESIKEVVNATGPKFVFMHVLLPHPPFVWTANGTAQEEDLTPYELYIEQVKYTETFLKEIIEAVPEDAILIIQADEGVCFTKPSLNYNMTENQWRGVLSAWRVPGDASLVNIVDILGYVVEKEAT